ATTEIYTLSLHDALPIYFRAFFFCFGPLLTGRVAPGGFRSRLLRRLLRAIRDLVDGRHAWLEGDFRLLAPGSVDFSVVDCFRLLRPGLFGRLLGLDCPRLRVRFRSPLGPVLGQRFTRQDREIIVILIRYRCCFKRLSRRPRRARGEVFGFGNAAAAAFWPSAARTVPAAIAILGTLGFGNRNWLPVGNRYRLRGCEDGNLFPFGRLRHRGRRYRHRARAGGADAFLQLQHLFLDAGYDFVVLVVVLEEIR